MNILIVDDEELTRLGVISSIDWSALGIDAVYQADDGMAGLALARQYRPEIILCDVRMPHMDGISMLNRIREFLPETAVIFMSGYSDKEYLKAAIKLKAVTYIEKPIRSEELTEALTDAVQQYVRQERSQRGVQLHHLETGARLISLLTSARKPSDTDVLRIFDELGLTAADFSYVTFLLVRIDPSIELVPSMLQSTQKNLSKILPTHVICQYQQHRSELIVFGLFSVKPPSESLLSDCSALLVREFSSLGKMHLAVSAAADGWKNSYSVYQEAVILMAHAYFFPSGSILTPSMLRSEISKDDIVPISELGDYDFEVSLQESDRTKIEDYLQHLFRNFICSVYYLPNQVRDLYYRLNFTLESLCIQQQILPGEDDALTTDQMEQCFLYEDLHEILCRRIDRYLAHKKQQSQENSTIRMIKDYIGEHYMEDSLSVKEISDHVFLSTSYVCTFFKNETGQTLNQFITEYRMERAKQLLRDPRYKITDIAALVGHSDGNYFGKSFKKYSGMSPSEFRERTL